MSKSSLLLVLLASCAAEPDVVSTTVEIRFPDQVGEVVPLNASDGLPVRVQVDVDGPVIRAHGGLTAHVWMVDGVGAQVGSGMTDIPQLTLEPTTDGHYSAIATLVVPWDGVSFPAKFKVAAEVDGTSKEQDGMLQAPAIAAGAPRLSPLWTGSAPRYQFCVETSAAKGFVDLAAADPVAIANQPAGAGTLLTGPCDPALPSGPALSHTTFIVTYAPTALPVTVALRGKPPQVDGSPWTATVPLPSSANPVVELTPAIRGTPIATAAGMATIVEVGARTADPTVSGNDVDLVGLGVTFGVIGGAGANFVNSSVTTDSAGTAASTIIVPYGAQLLATFSSAGGGAATLPLGAAAITLQPGTPVPLSSTLPGQLYEVSATAMAGSVAVPDVQLTFSGGGVTFFPTSVATDEHGTASSQVLVPFGAQAQIAVTGGGSSTSLLLSTAPASIVLGTPALRHATNASDIPIHVWADAAHMIPAAGVTLTLSGGTPQPATVVTDASGDAIGTWIVPYGATASVTVTGAGTFTSTVVTTPAVTLVLDPPTPASGGVRTLSAHAWADAAMTVPVAGLSLTFSVPNTSVASPTGVVTDINGNATTTLFNFTSGSLTVAGGGGFAAETL